MAAPPAEAKRQADGSFLLPQEDGSTLRWTKRPDGSWRKPEHRKAGFVGDLEQGKYVSPGAKVEQARQAQMQDPEDDFEQTKASRRNERKKEQRKEKAETKEEERIQAQKQATEVAAPAKVAAQTTAPVAAQAPEKKDEGAAKQKAVEKKLRQIADLEKKKANGEQLNEDQCNKVAQKQELQAELAFLVSGVYMEPPAPAPKAVEKAAPAPAVTEQVPVSKQVAEEPAQPQAPKSKKAIEKKLRQIAEIEEKQAKGEQLNEDQMSKLKAKKDLQKELKNAV